MAIPEAVAVLAVEALSGARGLPQVRWAFEASGAECAWRVRKLELREGLSTIYTCVLELATSDLLADVEALEGASCAVRVERGELTRRLCGLVWRVERLGSLVDQLLIRVEVRPALAALGQNQDSRIFQVESAAEILRKVLSRGLAPYQRSVRIALERSYRPREYCTQYAESDLDFALRLMSEEGIFFFFDHAGEREELVLVDRNTICPNFEPADGARVRIVGPEAPQELLPAETIGRLGPGRQVSPTGVTLRDFDWTRPGLDLTCPKDERDGRGRERSVYEHRSPVVIADYDAGRRAYSRDEGSLRAALRREALQAEARFALGESNLTGLAPGSILEVEPSDPALGEGRYLVLRVEHEGDATEEVQHRMEGGPLRRTRYRNRFTCIPASAPHRPPPPQRRLVAGPQTATVVGPEGQEIHTDPHGRIKVQFHWDREGARDDRSSCWIRVMQAWAGSGFGALFLPRVGMEVVIQFLDGDPDRPLVMGCVYNGASPPAVSLPQDKTRSAITTRTSPGGDGYNELAFEDAAEREEIAIRAQRDLRGQVLHDQSYQVGHDDSTAVSHDRSLQVGNDQSVTVGVDRRVQVGQDEVAAIGQDRTATVGRDEQTTVGANSTRAVGKDEAVSVGRNRQVSVGGKQSTKVRSSKVETVGLLSMETVKAAKMVNVGAAYSLNVGAAMNTVVGAASFEHVGYLKVVKAGAKIQLVCGKSKITLSKDGKIKLEGTEFEFKASGKVTINGSLIDLNP
jgi:type VI secretion system secreted protein VgrG